MLIDNQIKSYAVRDVFIVPHDEADRAVKRKNKARIR